MGIKEFLNKMRQFIKLPEPYVSSTPSTLGELEGHDVAALADSLSNDLSLLNAVVAARYLGDRKLPLGTLRYIPGGKDETLGRQ